MIRLRLLLATCILALCLDGALGQNSTSTNKTDTEESLDFDGWKHASSKDDLSEFKNDLGGFTFKFGPCFYGSGYSGTLVMKPNSPQPDGSLVSSSLTAADEDASINVKFDAGKAVVSGGDEYFWKVGEEGYLEWKASEEEATRFDVFVNEDEPDVMFFMVDQQVLSKGYTYKGTEDAKMRYTPEVLRTASWLSPFSLFTALSKNRLKCANEVVLAQRRSALKAGKDPSPIFLPYDYALSIPAGLDIFDFKSVTPRTDLDIYTLIRTLAWCVVLGEPSYKEHYYSLGNVLPSKFRIYEFIKSGNLHKSSLPNLAYNLRSEAAWRGPTVSEIHYGTLEFVGLLLEHAVKEDLESSNPLINNGLYLDSPLWTNDSTTMMTVMKNSFRASATLAFMTSNSTILEKLEYVDPMQVGNSKDAYMEKFDDGRYWFADLIDSNNDNINNEQAFVELALLEYVSGTKYGSDKDESNTESSLGDGVASAIMKELSPLLSKYHVGGLAAYSMKPGFTGALDVASRVCKDDTKLSFCVMAGAMSQANGLGSAYRSSFVAKETTRATGTKVINFQKYIKLILDKLDTDETIQGISDASAKLQNYMNQSVDEIADTIDERTLDGIKKQNEEVKSYVTDLGSYLKEVNEFGHDARVEQYKKRMEMMTKGIETSMDLQEDLFELIDHLTDKAKEEKAWQVALGALDLAIGIAAMLIPQTAFAKVAGKFASFASAGVQKAVGGFFKGAGSAAGQMSTASSQLSGFQGVIMGAKNLEDIGKLSDHVDKELTKELQDALARSNDVMDGVVKIREAILPIMNDGDELDEEALIENSNAFLNAYKSYSPPILASTADKIALAFSTVINSLCTQIDRNAYTPCVKGKPLASEVFGNLAEAITYGNDALSVLAELATSAVSIQQAKLMEKNAEEDDTTPDDSEINENKESRKAFWRQWQRRANYSSIVSKSIDMAERTRLIQATLEFCNYDTYQRGGESTSFCQSVFNGESLSREDIDKLVTAESNIEPSTKNITDAVVPTLPEEGEPTAYIDIGRLLAGETVSFHLPANQTWLKKHNWLPTDVKIEKDIITIEDIELYLVPPYSTYMEQANSAEVVMEFTGTSDLGPAADNKKVVIPGFKFRTSYEMLPADSKSCSSGTIKDWNADQCKGLPVVCQRSVGSGPHPGMYPSLFSMFEVSVILEENNGGLMQFDSLATQLYLHADATVRIVKGVEYDSVNDPLAEIADSSWEEFKSDEGSAAVELESLANESISAAGGSMDDSVGAGSNSSGGGNLSVGDDEDDTSDSGSVSIGDKDTAPSPSSLSSGGSGDQKKSSGDAERKLQEDVEGRCCAVGQYYNWSKSECSDCPPGSISQMGGLYCIYVTEEDFEAAVDGAGNDLE